MIYMNMEITDLLRRVHNGDAGALETLVPLVYDELKMRARPNFGRDTQIAPSPINTERRIWFLFEIGRTR